MGGGIVFLLRWREKYFPQEFIPTYELFNGILLHSCVSQLLRRLFNVQSNNAEVPTTIYHSGIRIIHSEILENMIHTRLACLFY